MKNNIFGILSLSLLLLIACGRRQKENSETEVSYGGGVSYTVFSTSSKWGFSLSYFNIPSDGSTALGDIVDKTKFCPPTVPYICAYGHLFSFAVPKRELHISDKWTFAGETYQVIPADSYSIPGGRIQGSDRPDWYMRVFGDEEHPYVIHLDGRPNPKHCDVEFLYSRAKGLLGRVTRCDDFSTTELSEGTYGYGSDEFNKQIPPSAYLAPDEALRLFSDSYKEPGLDSH